ncbi:MAG TPA: hypothetical protein ENN28_03360 [Candidatus Uhrbacteria bacterium]|nr:hypothetical protein [Candidatus Uhrbacteria bacterium]
MEIRGNEFIVEPGIFNVKIDYNKLIHELFANGDYNDADVDFCDFDPQGFGIDLVTLGQQNLNLRIIRFLRNIDTLTEAIGLIVDNGFEPAGVRHLLTLGMTYPYLQRACPVITLEPGADHYSNFWWLMLTVYKNFRCIRFYGWTCWDDHFPGYGIDCDVWYLVIQP